MTTPNPEEKEVEEEEDTINDDLGEEIEDEILLHQFYNADRWPDDEEEWWDDEDELEGDLW